MTFKAVGHDVADIRPSAYRYISAGAGAGAGAGGVHYQASYDFLRQRKFDGLNNRQSCEATVDVKWCDARRR